ncbi:MAG: M20/M25/M40 family metallo-hydrolase [Bacteroidales bacterium]|jgi:hypothetical protein|nr:M20/M25/M40 family metallo-hydrolase [Bacteroidales bacterium]
MKKLLLVLIFFFSLNSYAQNQEKSIEKNVYFLASDLLEGRYPATKGDSLAAEFIAQEFKRLNIQPFFETYYQKVRFYDLRNANSFQERKIGYSRNVVGIIQGEDEKLKNEYIVIGAHFDHLGYGGKGSGSRSKDSTKIHYGADDNASGTALMLSLAEKFSKTKPKRSIIFIAFCCEEEGLVGSRFFVDNLEKIKPEQINIMLNFDMVGKMKNKVLTLSGAKTARHLERMIKKTNTYNLDIIFSKNVVSASDHASFYAKDIPVLYFTTGADSTYHTPDDIPPLLNYKDMELLSNYSFDLINYIDKRNKKLQFHRVKEPSQKRTNVKITLGIMPDVTSDNYDGMKALIVSKGKPADKAGMKSGDIILEINKKKVNDVYSYMEILNSLNEKENIEVKIKRDKKIKTLKIKL